MVWCGVVLGGEGGEARLESEAVQCSVVSRGIDVDVDAHTSASRRGR